MMFSFFFFCRVINPPSIEMYNQFVNAAKLVTTTPAVSDCPYRDSYYH